MIIINSINVTDDDKNIQDNNSTGSSTNSDNDSFSDKKMKKK